MRFALYMSIICLFLLITDVLIFVKEKKMISYYNNFSIMILSYL